jgi:hypothetical protein
VPSQDVPTGDPDLQLLSAGDQNAVLFLEPTRQHYCPRCGSGFAPHKPHTLVLGCAGCGQQLNALTAGTEAPPAKNVAAAPDDCGVSEVVPVATSGSNSISAAVEAVLRRLEEEEAAHELLPLLEGKMTYFPTPPSTGQVVYADSAGMVTSKPDSDYAGWLRAAKLSWQLHRQRRRGHQGKGLSLAEWSTAVAIRLSRGRSQRQREGLYLSLDFADSGAAPWGPKVEGAAEVKKLVGTRWTVAEDSRLIGIMSVMQSTTGGPAEHANGEPEVFEGWTMVAEHVGGGRTGSSCRNHWAAVKEAQAKQASILARCGLSLDLGELGLSRKQLQEIQRVVLKRRQHFAGALLPATPCKRSRPNGASNAEPSPDRRRVTVWNNKTQKAVCV